MSEAAEEMGHPYGVTRDLPQRVVQLRARRTARETIAEHAFRFRFLDDQAHWVREIGGAPHQAGSRFR